MAYVLLYSPDAERGGGGLLQCILTEIGLEASLEWIEGIGLAARVKMEAELGSWMRELRRHWTKSKE